jgi:serine/threonine-protein kinase
VAQIYFDEDELRRGKFFEIPDVIRGDDRKGYEIGEWLGRGGNGSVFACYETTTGDAYAIKFLLLTGYAVTRRFQREAQLMKRVKHEHVVSLITSGTAQATNVQRRLPFIIMERADHNLSEAIKKAGVRFAPEVYIGQFRGLVGGLAAMHALAIHRDIKPENILVSGDRWLLGDYGLCKFIARSTEEISGDRLVQGPRFWLSPEVQNRRVGNDDEISPASDVYQLAAVFWYVATGRHPSGILGEQDWQGPAWLFPPLFRALQHGLARRPVDGTAFAEAIEHSIHPN